MLHIGLINQLKYNNYYELGTDHLFVIKGENDQVLFLIMRVGQLTFQTPTCKSTYMYIDSFEYQDSNTEPCIHYSEWSK